MRRYRSLSLDGKEDMIKEGYRATIEAMPAIQKLFAGNFKKDNDLETKDIEVKY